MNTILVAAADARQRSKNQAEITCHGTNDHVQIQAAIDAVSAVGGGQGVSV